MSAINKNAKKSIQYLLQKYWYVILSFVVMIVILNIIAFFLVDLEKNTLLERQRAIQSEEISVINIELDQVINDTIDVMNIMLDSNETTNYILDSSVQNTNDLEQMIYRVSTNQSQFLKVRVVDLSGNEIAGVIRDDSGLHTLTEYQNISDRYFFINTVNIPYDKFYISNLDLETVNGQVLYPYEPMIRFVKPLVDSNNQVVALMIVNYDVFDLLAIFNEDITYMNDFSDFGLMSNGTFYRFSYEETQDVYLLDYIGTDEEILTCPDTMFVAPNFSSTYIDSILTEDDFIQIYSHIHLDDLYVYEGSIFLNQPWMIVGLNLFVVSIFAIFALEVSKRNSDKILLNGTMYLADRYDNCILMTSYKRKVFYVNESFEKLFGYTLDEMRGYDQQQFIETDFEDRFDQVGVNNYTYHNHIWNVTKSGVYILSDFELKAIHHFSGIVQYYIGEYRLPSASITKMFDVTLNQNDVVEERLKILSSILVNREIEVNATSIFLIEISPLLNNDALGYKRYMRIELYNAIKDAFKGIFDVYVVNKEYLFLIGNLDLEKEYPTDFVEKITVVMDESVNYYLGKAKREYLISFDKITSESKSYQDLIRNVFIANEALHHSDTETFNIYHPDMTSAVSRDYLIVSQLESAFSLDQFYMNYQIQRNMETDELTGVEALIRWENPLLGIVNPNDFISKIERTPYTRQLTKTVIRKVVQDLAPYGSRFPKDFHIAVNFTPYDFQNYSLMQDIVKMIEESPLPTSLFCFEITESDYLENRHEVNAMIKYLHSKSIIVAIDDFGKGFSSLSVLKDLNVDKIKIDRIFIMDYPIHDDGKLYKSLVNLATSFNLSVLTEGIETKEQYDLAKSSGSKKYQGYFISKPLDINTFIETFFPLGK